MFVSTTTGEVAQRLGGDAQALRAIARAGFEACDFSMWSYPWKGGVWDLADDAFDAYFTDLKALARDCGVEVWQTHAPFPTTTGDPGGDAERLAAIRRAIRATALLGSRYIIVHPIMHAPCRTEADHARALAENIAFYRSLIPELAEHRVKLAIENMFGWDEEADRACPIIFSTAEEIVSALVQLGDDHFCACLDVGHAGLAGQHPAKMAETLGPWLKTLHVHDNDGHSDLHTLPFLGVIDWDAVCKALRRIEYPGTMNLEADEFLPKFPVGMEGAALRLMAETANNLLERVQGEP